MSLGIENLKYFEVSTNKITFDSKDKSEKTNFISIIMFRLQRSLCLTRIISSQLIRTLPRSAAPADYALINPTNPSPNVVFNDYKLTTKQSAPKLPDIQTGLNKYLLDCDEHSLLLTLESKYKLFDSNLVAIFIQRLHDLNIKRDSNERHHQRLYDFVDYLSRSFLPLYHSISFHF